MAAAKGNNYAAKRNPWREAIQRAVAQSDKERLRRIAEKLLDNAEAGDMAAMREVGDRLDGKPSQAIEHTGNVGLLSILGAMIDGKEADIEPEHVTDNVSH